MAAGTVGAVGAAIAIGLTTHTGGATAGTGNDDDQAQFAPQRTQQDPRPIIRPSRGDGEDDGEEESEDGSRSTQGLAQNQQPKQVAPNGQLATPGGGGSPQAGSSGS
jgi:hypothetical protein